MGPARGFLMKAMVHAEKRIQHVEIVPGRQDTVGHAVV